MGTVTSRPNKVGELTEEVLQLFEAVKEGRGVEVVDVYEEHIGLDGLRSLIVALSKQNDVHTLRLGDNNFEDEGCDELCEFLINNPDSVVRNLYLGVNQLTEKCVPKICELLNQPHCRIETLHLGGNDLKDSGVQQLCEALKASRSVRAVGLSGNNLTAKSCEHIAEMLKENSLISVLELCDNKIGDSGAENLLEGMRVNPTLKKLELSDKTITFPKKKAMYDCLQKNRAAVRPVNPTPRAVAV